MIIYFEVTRQMLEDQGLKIDQNSTNRFLWNLNKDSYLNLSDEAGKIIELCKKQDYDSSNEVYKINEHLICCAELTKLFSEEFYLEKQDTIKLINSVLKDINKNFQFKEPLMCSIFDIFSIQSFYENFINNFINERGK